MKKSTWDLGNTRFMFASSIVVLSSSLELRHDIEKTQHDKSSWKLHQKVHMEGDSWYYAAIISVGFLSIDAPQNL